MSSVHHIKTSFNRNVRFVLYENTNIKLFFIASGIYIKLLNGFVKERCERINKKTTERRFSSSQSSSKRRKEKKKKLGRGDTGRAERKRKKKSKCHILMSFNKKALPCLFCF